MTTTTPSPLSVLILLVPIAFIGCVACFIYAAICTYSKKRDEEFNETEYARVTKKTRRETLFDTGNRGEFNLYRNASKHFESEECYWLFNVYVPKENGRTTEIDAIFYHKTGIYVIESKNYGGWIFGHEEQDQWTQCLPGRYGQAKKYRFYNPIKQNTSHIDCYRKWLGAEYCNVPIYSVILFGNQCELKQITLTSQNHFVGVSSDFHDIVQSAMTANRYSDMTIVKKIYTKTYPLSQASDTTKQLHVESIRSTHRPKHDQNVVTESPSELNDSIMICPLCSGKLVCRIAKRGLNQGKYFIGCSNFPKCRYTKNIN